MATQGPPKLSPESPLVTNDTTSNVAVNQQVAKDLRAANVDGKDIYPSRVFTKDLSLETSLTVGSGVQLTDGCVSADNLASDSVTTDKIAANAVTASEISVSSLSSVSANLGSITGGSLAIGAGGVTISNGATGISIGTNSITCIYGGGPTVTIDGATGVITASKFALTADAGSSLDMTLGSLTIGATGTINGTPVSTIAAATTTFAQTSIPTSTAIGDLWCDTDAGNKLYRAASVGANEIKAGEWVAVQDTAYTSKNVTFAQDATPTALAAGDIWIDTNDGNKMYRATAAGSGSWVAVLDAILTGGYVTVDSNNNITNISTAGINVGTGTSGARTQITSNGLAVYNSGGTVIDQVDHTNGFMCNNVSGTPDVVERFSVAYGGSEVGYFAADSASQVSLIGGTPGIKVQISSATVDITASDEISLESDVVRVQSGGALTFEAGSVDPTITAGTAPSEGGASSEPLGSIKLGVGGSLWLTISNSGNKWTRVQGANANAATAHPT